MTYSTPEFEPINRQVDTCTNCGPFVKYFFLFFFLEEDEQYNEQINTLFRTVHIGSFNTSVQVRAYKHLIFFFSF